MHLQGPFFHMFKGMGVRLLLGSVNTNKGNEVISKVQGREYLPLKLGNNSNISWKTRKKEKDKK